MVPAQLDGVHLIEQTLGQPGQVVVHDDDLVELPNGPTLLFNDAGGNRTQTVEALRPAPPSPLKKQGHSFGFPEDR